MTTYLQKCILLLGIVIFCSTSFGQPVEIIRHEQEYSTAQIEPVRYNGAPALAVHFRGTDDLHYYADPQSAPAPGLELKAAAEAQGVRFGQALFPEPEAFYDTSQQQNIDVYVGDFYLLLPIESYSKELQLVPVTVRLSGIACTSRLCLPPFEKTLNGEIDFSTLDTWPEVAFTPAATARADTPAAEKDDDLRSLGRSASETALMLLLALAAGLAFNVMPCVLPVLPLVVSRMVNIAKEKPSRRLALGLTFCVGIAAFFMAMGVFSSVLRLTTGAVFNLSDPYRYATFDIIMVVFLVLFAMFMFDVLPLTLPSGLSGRTADAGTFGGSFGMGFLAAILSIPCSGAILAAVLIWVQTQPWLMGFWVFLLMGIGMALPYAVLVAAPNLLNRLPKPGGWMEQFKKTMGFALLLLAIKPLSALPKEQLAAVASFAVVAAFSAWMWGAWVSFSTPRGKKWLIRGAAVLIAVSAGLWLLPQKTDLIEWVDYDRGRIEDAVAHNRPVLIKFTADWCTNCKILEDRVFRDPQVAAALKEANILPVKADTTLADFPAAVDLQQIYGIPGTVPMTILLVPGHAEPIRLPGIYDKRDLFDAIQAVD